MADAADSKSAGGNFVRVQVPPAAVTKNSCKPEIFSKINGLQLFFCGNFSKTNILMEFKNHFLA